MKKTIKLFGISVLVVIIGLSMVSCENLSGGSGANGGGTTIVITGIPYNVQSPQHTGLILFLGTEAVAFGRPTISRNSITFQMWTDTTFSERFNTPGSYIVQFALITDGTQVFRTNRHIGMGRSNISFSDF